MYQTHTPHRQNHLVGASAAVIVTALAAVGISAGLARDIIMQPEQVTEIALIDAPEETVTPTEVVQPDLENIEIEPDILPLEIVIPEIEIEIPAETAIAVERPPETPPVAAPVSGSGSSAPSLIVNNKPAYPPASIRGQEEGVTTLSVCVSDSGRAQSVQVTESSGFARLDDAALNWMRNARFKPATMDGRKRAVCGHVVAYEWNLEDAR